MVISYAINWNKLWFDRRWSFHLSATISLLIYSPYNMMKLSRSAKLRNILPDASPLVIWRHYWQGLRTSGPCNQNDLECRWYKFQSNKETVQSEISKLVRFLIEKAEPISPLHSFKHSWHYTFYWSVNVLVSENHYNKSDRFKLPTEPNVFCCPLPLSTSNTALCPWSIGNKCLHLACSSP